jgi:hypothetical protein
LPGDGLNRRELATRSREAIRTCLLQQHHGAEIPR